MSLRESFEFGSRAPYEDEGWTFDSGNATISSNWTHGTLASVSSEGSYSLYIGWWTGANTPTLDFGPRYLHFALKITAWDGGGASPTFYMRESGTTQCYVTIDSIGRIYAYRGTTLIKSSSNLIPAPYSAHILVIELLAQETSGILKVDIDGINYIDFSGDTRNTSTDGWDQVRWEGLAGATFYVDDVFIHSAAEGKQTDEVYAYPLRPTSDSTVQLTRSTGTTNFGCVDEEPASQTKYNEADAANESDEYGTGPSLPTFDSILGISVKAWVARDGTITQARVGAKSSTSYDYGDGWKTLVASPDWDMVRAEINDDPNTTVAWTGTAIGNMLGIIEFQ